VLGPEKLPRVVAEFGRWVGRARAMARQFREQLEEEVQLEEARRAQRTPPPPPPAEAPTPAPQPGPPLPKTYSHAHPTDERGADVSPVPSADERGT
jgi:sec-independent protein translocase protein TatB